MTGRKAAHRPARRCTGVSPALAVAAGHEASGTVPNVRIAPLPRAHQSPVRLLEDYPECVVFSSDYAHNESNPEPTAHYDALLAGVDADRRASFLGANIADCYARMGDPLPETAIATR